MQVLKEVEQIVIFLDG